MGGDLDTVVVVDDDEACRDLHAIWLEDPYVVRKAASGTEALDLADVADVMLLDRQMPDLNGDAVARRLREDGYDCFVVMLSGVEPDFDIVDLPVDEYLTKPVSREEVRGVVETMFARAVSQRLLRELFSLCARKDALERRKRPTELAESEEYRKLNADLEAKRVAVEEMVTEFDGEWRDTLLEAVARETDVLDELVHA